jgi:hypothetical protein
MDAYQWDNAGAQLGMSAALTEDEVLFGATRPNQTFGEEGFVAVFSQTPADCDSDGIPDFCETDCDFDDIPDNCAIATNPNGDCDLNGQPDGCQEPAKYALDVEGPITAWGFSPFFPPPFDYVWLNHYTVVPGGQYITHISQPWTWSTHSGDPITLLVYDDPNNDGDPHDAVLLTAVPASVPRPDYGALTPSTTATVSFTVHAVPTT